MNHNCGETMEIVTINVEKFPLPRKAIKARATTSCFG